LYFFVINFDFNFSTYYILQNLIVPISTLSEALKKAKESKDNLSVIQPIDKFAGYFNYNIKNNIKKKYIGVKGIYLWVNNINGKSYVVNL
jgi:hypothetical protein